MRRLRQDIIRATLEQDAHLTPEYTDELITKMRERSRKRNEMQRSKPRKPKSHQPKLTRTKKKSLADKITQAIERSS